MMTKMILKATIKLIEKRGYWTEETTRKDFLELISQAIKERKIDNKTAADLTIRAMAI